MDVRKKGLYTIELRRWPAETGFAISAGIDGDDVPWNRKSLFASRSVSGYDMSSGCTSRHRCLAENGAISFGFMCGCVGEDIDEKEEHFYSGGTAMDLRWAQLSIGA